MAEPQHSNISPHRTPRGAQRIQDLTSAAAELFLERGYEDVAMDELIARVGGSRRNIYSHFGGKEGLFIESMTQLCAELSRPLEQLEIPDGPAQEALSAFGLALLRAVLHPRTLELHRLMVAEGKRFPELAQAIFHAGHARAALVLACWIEARQKRTARHVPAIAAHTLSQQFVNMVVTELQLQALIGLVPLPQPAHALKRVVDDAVSAFLNANSL